jgi:hypothetical protein
MFIAGMAGMLPDVSYWIRNTDGDANYPEHKKGIRNFDPYKDLMIDPQTQQRICPQL